MIFQSAINQSAKPGITRVDSFIASQSVTIKKVWRHFLKHAFEPGSAGVMTIRFETTPEKLYRLEVADNGKGMSWAVTQESKDSLGMRLVAAFVEQLQGEMSVTNESGTSFIIEFPVVAGMEEVRKA